MPIEITVPRLGWSMDEGTFGEWLKADGEFVEKGEMVFVLEGDKAAHEIESLDSGTLHIPADAPQPGDEVKVGELIGYLLEEGETPPASVRLPVTPEVKLETPKPPTSAIGGTPSTSRRATRTAVQPLAARVSASPRARRRARELGIDWSIVPGSGINGRIRERDVIQFAGRSHAKPLTDFPPAAPGKHHPASKVRRSIARRMSAAVHQAAPVTLTTKTDATQLVAFRDRLKAEAGESPAPAYTDIIVKLVAAALPECPELNACWYNDGVYLYDDVNIALAVDTEEGLVAPVIENVPALSLAQTAQRSRTLIEQARAGTLSEDQMQNGTFTVTNLGSFGVDFFTPILNLPQSAILGIGRIVQEPVVKDNQIVIGMILGLSLTFDHRVIDGAPAARWLQRLSQLIADMQRELP